MDIQLLEIDPATKRAHLKLGFKAVTGITKLLQIVVLSLLNVPGRDILDPEAGGGLPAMIGQNFDIDDLAEIMGEVTRRVRKTESEVQNSQIGLDCPANERLRELQVINVRPGENSAEVLVRLRIVNELGQKADVVI